MRNSKAIKKNFKLSQAIDDTGDTYQDSDNFASLTSSYDEDGEILFVSLKSAFYYNYKVQLY